MEIKIIGTAITIVMYFIIRLLLNKVISRTVEKNVLQKVRGKIIKKVLTIILLSIAIVILFAIWGVDQSELAVFIGTVLTVLGISLVAQWSFLSNITSGVIIFFSHPVKLGDIITIMDKDYPIEGRISDIGLFFVILKTTDEEKITLPSNVFVQKMIKSKSQE
ncbi:MAG: mechanosensitive ion channel [Vicingus serpentipes]|nr:mechanosensitive ion channel [Vicingus serpentipes]